MRNGDISNKCDSIIAVDSRALVVFKKLSLLKRLLKVNSIDLNMTLARHIDMIWRDTDLSVAIVNRWDSGIDSDELEALLEENHIAYSKIEIIDSEEELERLCDYYFTFYFYSKETLRIPPKSYPVSEFYKLTKKG